MPTFDISTEGGSAEIEAEYYVIEDGFLTLKDSGHKQVASFNVDNLRSISRVSTNATSGTATVTILPQIDQAAFEKAVEAAVARAESAMRRTAPDKYDGLSR